MRDPPARPRGRGRRLGNGRHHRRPADAGQEGLAEPRPPRAGHAAVGGRAHLDGAAVDGDSRAAAATPSASPAASPASSPTIATSTRASSRCGRSACRTSWRAARSSSSPATRACRTRGGDDARPRRQRHDRGGDGGGARRRVLRDLLGRRRRVFGRSARRPDARRIGTLSYEETQEMAEAGAKVLNAQAVEFAKEKGIAIYARATEGPLPGPDPSSDGTVVRRSPPRMPGTVVGVASERDIVMLDGDGAPGDAARACWPSAASPASSCTSSATGRRSPSRARTCTTKTGCATALSTRLGGRARLIDGLAAVSVDRRRHQRDLRQRAGRHGDAGRTRHPRRAGIATSSFRITWMVPARSHERRRARAARALHRVAASAVAVGITGYGNRERDQGWVRN